MTEVRFYLSNASGADALFNLVRRLAGAALQRQRQVYIHCQDARQSNTLDNWLWQNPKGGFLPHSLAGHGSAPILLGSEDPPADQHDVMINLAADVPDFFSRFLRVVEPVNNDENKRQEARQCWRFYQNRGYPIKKHDV